MNNVLNDYAKHHLPYREHFEAGRRRGLLARRLARLVIERRKLAREIELATTLVYESRCRASLLTVERDLADVRATLATI